MTYLELPFEEDEVNDVVWLCANDKSTCPDGYNMNFFKANWDILKYDVLNFVSFCFRNSKLSKVVIASFLTLILKTENLQSFGEYRPICLTTSIYRILSKLLASRLRRFLDGLISKNSQLFFRVVIFKTGS